MICELKIPNREVEYLYEDIIRSWFNTSIQSRHHRMMLEALTSGNTETFADIFSDFVEKTFSMFDTGEGEPEKVYHAFVPGLLVSQQDTYEVKSNRETGYGRYDVMLIPKTPAKESSLSSKKYAKAKRWSRRPMPLCGKLKLNGTQTI